MKSYDLCKKYGFDLNNFEEFLRTNSIEHKEGFLGSSVNDSDVERIVSLYKEDLIIQEQRKKEEPLRREQREKEELLRQEEIKKIKLTTGYDFQGYFITDYIDVFFDEILFGIGLGTGISSSIDNFLSSLSGGEAIEMIQKLNDIKTELRKRVMSKAQKVGANALIGIDFESSRLGDLLMVSMTATAVRIEKIIDPLPITESSTTSLQHEKELAKKEIQEAN